MKYLFINSHLLFIYRFVGYCDYGNILTFEECEKQSTEVLDLMLSSLKNKWKWPIGYWFVNKIKSNVQAKLIRICIAQCVKFGINVVTVTCDGVYANSTTFKTLGCHLRMFKDSNNDLIE